MTATAINPKQQQRQEGLQKAHRVKQARAALKQELAALGRPESCALAASAVEEMPEAIRGMLAVRFLQTVNGIGDRRRRGLDPATAEPILEACGIGVFAEMGKLTERQRGALAAALRARHR